MEVGIRRGTTLFWLIVSSWCLGQGMCPRELQECRCLNIRTKSRVLCRLGRGGHLRSKSVGASSAGEYQMKKEIRRVGLTAAWKKTTQRGRNKSAATMGKQRVQEIEMTLESVGPGSNPGLSVTLDMLPNVSESLFPQNAWRRLLFPSPCN